MCIRDRIRTVPLVPMHELREVKGTFDELMDRRNYEGTAVDEMCIRDRLRQL